MHRKETENGEEHRQRPSHRVGRGAHAEPKSVTGNWTKRDRDSDSRHAGEWLDTKTDGAPFKGVAKEPDGRRQG